MKPLPGMLPRGAARRGGLEPQRVPRRSYCLLALHLLLSLGLASPAFAQSSGQVRGQVRSESQAVPLSRARVELAREGWVRQVNTDSAGHYLLTHVPSGRTLLRVHHPGHEPVELEIQVAADREVFIEITLPLAPIELDPVHVQGRYRGAAIADSIPEAEAALGRIAARTLESSSGVAELGLAEAARAAPGREPGDASGVLYIRGAAADLKLVYLDGAPVYAPFPVAGVLEPFTPGLLHDAEIYLGGAPARYDGGLSQITDLRTRSAGALGVRTSGSLDLLSGHLLAEAANDDRFALTGLLRGVHPFATTQLLGPSSRYAYGEGLLRGDLRLSEASTLSSTYFSNAESVRFDATEPADRSIAWGNRAGSIRLQSAIGKSSADLVAAAGRYHAELPLAGRRSPLATGSAERLRLSANIARPMPGFHLQYGISFDRQHYRAAAVWEGEEGGAEVRSAGEVAGIHGEASGQLGPRLHLRAGARIDRFTSARAHYTVAPRFAATWLLNESAFLTFAAGRYHQFLRPPEEVLLGAAESFGHQRQLVLTVANASHFTVGLDQELPEGYRLGLEGYYKTFGNIPGAFVSDLRASGVDLWVHRGQGRTTGWLGYSLAWAWAGSELSATEAFLSGNHAFTGRHMLSAGLETPLASRTQLEVRFAYGAGLPYTAVPLGESGRYAQPHIASASSTLRDAAGGNEMAPLLPTPEEAYLRLDASITRLFTARRGSRTFEIAPYLRIMNGLGRRDALFYLSDPHEEEMRRIGHLPVVPIVGVEWDF